MSQTQEAVEIIDGKTGNSVKAILHKELGEFEVIDVELIWALERVKAIRRLRQQGVPPADLPDHVHWNWAVKAVRHAGFLAFQYFGIEADGKMQGLMMVCTTGKQARLHPDIGKPLVYVDFLETAPWNAREFTTSPIYKGVGVRLMQAAARLSIDEGFAGRVGLHALPQATPFYTSACQMHPFGPDAGYHNLEYFELAAAKVAELLKK